MSVDNQTGITEEKNTNPIQLDIFPNPAHSVLHVKSNKVISSVSLFSLDGKLIQVYDANNANLTLDVSQLNSNLYFIKTTIEGKTLLKKIAINN